MKPYRFVFLLHRLPAKDHWDVMLETDTALRTWSIPPQTLTNAFFECSAKPLPDHRKHYLDYEGMITGNRGHVFRIDAGTYHSSSPTQFVLEGSIFVGTLTINTSTLSFAPRLLMSGEQEA